MAVHCHRCHSEVQDDSRFCSKCGAPIDAAPEELGAFTRTLVTPSAGISLGSLLAGKYRILEEVGHGGMGIVYKAEDMSLKRPVAIKFLPRELCSNPEMRERFIQEARAAAALSHPNICTIHEVDESEDNPFIVMEFVDGETLRERTKKSPLPVEEALNIAIQTADGLEKAHQKGIVHRDVKSANIMLTESGQVKIMDFGLAKLGGGTAFTKEGATLGTVAYMSPEQARGERVDSRTDIWSLGIVFHEMLTGELPFRGERDVSILYSIVHEEPRGLKDKKPPIPTGLQHIVEKALAKNPASRYQTAGEMLKELRGALEGLRMASAGVFNLRSVLRHLRRPAVAVPSGIALLALAALLVGLSHRQSRINWARETLLPQIEQAIIAEDSGRDNLVAAYGLVQEAEKYISGDPKLSELTSKCAVTISVETEPPGAHVSFKKYSAPDSGWQELGTSPLKDVRLPMGIFRWKLVKEGYETVEAAAFTYKRDESKSYFNVANNFKRVLDKTGSLPPGMVRVAGGQVRGIGNIDDFYIDRFEVTNRQFKAFVDQGGYQKKEFWKHPFIMEGKTVSWEEAMAGFVDQTGRPGPATWEAGAFPQGHEDYPVSGVSWYEAAAFAEFAEKELPTEHHWGVARGRLTPLYQSGFLSVIYPLSNFQQEGPAPVGKYQGLTSYGAFDMAGNVREWCWNETSDGRLVRGGAWNDINYMFGNLSQAPAFDRSPKNGFRCVRYLDRSRIPAAAFAPTRFDTSEQLTPVPSQIERIPDSVFRVYKDQFAYDARDLKARIESTSEEARDWTKQKVTFDMPSGNDRLTAYLFLPKNSHPPYQTVIYFPGSSAQDQTSSQDLEKYVWFEVDLSFLMQNGRAVIFPIYTGTFELADPKLRNLELNSRARTEYYVRLIKEFRRSMDYLESRSDIDSGRIAFLGFSWGGWLGAVITAVEDRLKVSILKTGGLRDNGRPEINPINYVTRVKLPTLMLNGRYDMTFPYETTVKPMFDLLGTRKEDKVLKLYETDHFIPRNEFIKETLAWLDKYLGPTK